MRHALALLWLFAFACGGPPIAPGDDGGAEHDGGAAVDSGTPDDAGTGDDAGALDAGTEVDAGALDSGAPDAGTVDAGALDSGTPDAGRPDAGSDAGVGRQPPPFPAYSGGACPTLVSGATRATARNLNFRSGTDDREFLLMVPPGYTPTRSYPLVFGYHWLNASANSVVSDAELESAIAQYQFIAVVPENLMNGSQKAYAFDWPFVETTSAPKELLLFDDLLACVSGQFNVDRSRVHVFGASAGGLWTTYLSTTPSVDRVASLLTISGGLGQDPFNVWRIPYVAQPNRFPALVIWGGPTDFLGLDFHGASLRYRDALTADNHFVTTCQHSAGHGIPPFPATTDGGTRFAAFWDFFDAHPYGLAADTSPWRSSGLPSTFPSYCAIIP